MAVPVTVQTINTGTVPNDGTGDPLNVAGGKINSNFSILATEVADRIISSGEVLARVVVPANSAAEVVVYTHNIIANTLAPGQGILISLSGTITQRNNNAAFYTIRVKYGTQVLFTMITPAATAIAAQGFALEIMSTVRSVAGAIGQIISRGCFMIDTLPIRMEQGVQTALDATQPNSIVVTMQCNEANAADGPVNIEQGCSLTR